MFVPLSALAARAPCPYSGAIRGARTCRGDGGGLPPPTVACTPATARNARCAVARGSLLERRRSAFRFQVASTRACGTRADRGLYELTYRVLKFGEPMNGVMQVSTF
jgi:hypothetical protein